MPLFRVPTGAVGPSGPISDVFSGTEHISNPTDPRLAGIDINSLPVGQAPSGFQSAFPSVISANDISKSTDQGVTSADNNATVNKAQGQSQTILDKLNGFLTANESLAKNIGELATPTPEETKTLQNIRALDLANQKDISNFRNTPDNTFFTFGRQGQAVLDTTALTRQSLINTLQSETASRQAKLDAAKFLYDANRSSVSDTLNLYKSTAPDNISTQVDPITGNVFVITRNPLTGQIGKQNTGVFVGNKDDKITVNNLIQKYPDVGISPTDSLIVASGKVKNSAIFAKETRTGTTLTEDRDSAVSAFLESKKGADGYVAAATYQKALRGFIARGGTQTNFFASFPQQIYLRQQEIDKLPAAIRPQMVTSKSDLTSDQMSIINDAKAAIDQVKQRYGDWGATRQAIINQSKQQFNFDISPYL